MLVAMAGFLKAALLYMKIHLVAMLAGKALIIAKVALAIAVAVALKKSMGMYRERKNFSFIPGDNFKSIFE